MSADLREELDVLARTQTFSPDPSAWDRGRRARRRTRLAAGLVTVAVVAVAAGAGAIAVRPASVGPAGDVVSDGAIPSRIDDVADDLGLTTDLAVGRASVAFVSPTSGRPVVIGAQDGRYHQLALPDAPEDGGLLALSPDGARLAWSNNGRMHTADLEDGTGSYYGSDAEHASVTALYWAPDSRQLLWNGTDEKGRTTGGVLPADGPVDTPLRPAALRGIPSPNGQMVAMTSVDVGPAAAFLTRRGEAVERQLPADLYADGAAVTPVGWADDHLLVAEVDAPAGSYVEGPHLVLMTSPDRPKSEWTYRILMRDVPDAVGLSLAVDLVPDLDGTSSQPLTHDFDADEAPPAPLGIELSLFIGIGVAAAIGVLMGLRRLWRRLS